MKPMKENATLTSRKVNERTQACFSISIIVVGFISGVHYCLIGLLERGMIALQILQGAVRMAS